MADTQKSTEIKNIQITKDLDPFTSKIEDKNNTTLDDIKPCIINVENNQKIEDLKTCFKCKKRYSDNGWTYCNNCKIIKPSGEYRANSINLCRGIRNQMPRSLFDLRTK